MNEYISVVPLGIVFGTGVVCYLIGLAEGLTRGEEMTFRRYCEPKPNPRPRRPIIYPDASSNHKTESLRK